MMSSASSARGVYLITSAQTRNLYGGSRARTSRRLVCLMSRWSLVTTKNQHSFVAQPVSRDADLGDCTYLSLDISDLLNERPGINMCCFIYRCYFQPTNQCIPIVRELLIFASHSCPVEYARFFTNYIFAASCIHLIQLLIYQQRLFEKDGYRQQNMRQRQKLNSIIDYDVCILEYFQPFWRFSTSKNGLTLKSGYGSFKVIEKGAVR